MCYFGLLRDIVEVVENVTTCFCMIHTPLLSGNLVEFDALSHLVFVILTINNVIRKTFKREKMASE